MRQKTLYLFLFWSLVIVLLPSNATLAQRHKTDSYDFRDNLRVNTITNVAEVMYSTDKKVYTGSAEEVARQFLQENKDIFGITKIFI